MPTDPAHRGTNHCGHILLTGLFGNLVLAALKIAVGVLECYRLILMDGMFSCANAVALLFAWHGDQLEKKAADMRHPYGYGKFMFLAMSVAGLVVLVISIYMFFYGLVHMTGEEVHCSYTAAVMVSLISVIGNELIYRYLSEESRLHSNSIVAWNAVNSRLNAAVSLLGLIAIGLSAMGMPYFERLGVVVISTIMFCMGLRMLFWSFAGIMDGIPSREVLNRIGSSTCAVQGVREVVNIKARHVGAFVHIDLGIAVDEEISMGEADVIAREVEGILANAIPNTKEVNVILA